MRCERCRGLLCNARSHLLAAAGGCARCSRRGRRQLWRYVGSAAESAANGCAHCHSAHPLLCLSTRTALLVSNMAKKAPKNPYAKAKKTVPKDYSVRASGAICGRAGADAQRRSSTRTSPSRTRWRTWPRTSRPRRPASRRARRGRAARSALPRLPPFARAEAARRAQTAMTKREITACKDMVKRDDKWEALVK